MRGLPDSVRRDVEAVLSERGEGGRIVSATPAGGGCVNHGAHLVCDDHRNYFVKWNSGAAHDMFEAEADGLAMLARGPLRVPSVRSLGGGGDHPSWLLLEYLAPSTPSRRYLESLGRGLAHLHRGAAARDSYGWRRDNYIGSLPQANDSSASWVSFWRDLRLYPQLRMARAAGAFTGRGGLLLDDLLDGMAEALAGSEADGRSLLHGDLWGGNAYAGPGGEPVIIDPAVYVGHREVDLAMTELFGGFGDSFYGAYEEEWPLDAAYRAGRREVYQLYYLLVHVNLFGAGYVDGTLHAARRALRLVS